MILACASVQHCPWTRSGVVARGKREVSVCGFARTGLMRPQEGRWSRCSKLRISKRHGDFPALFVIEPDPLVADKALVGVWERRHLLHARQDRDASPARVFRNAP